MKSWINRERFPNYSKVDSFTLYAMGDSGNFTAVLSAATCGTKLELLVVQTEFTGRLSLMRRSDTSIG